MKFTKNYIKIIQNSIHIRPYSSINQVRVRFAPSPTGYLHLGGLRTALYNYLYARKHNGIFILRIEDTDQSRLIPGAAESLNDDLIWAGIDIDESPWHGGDYGPYVQSNRLHFYKEHIKLLLDNGTAYRCFCTDRRLDLIKRESLRLRQVPKYDNKCRHLSKEEIHGRLDKGDEYCIRFKLNNCEESFNDLVYGKVNITLNEGDPVILKSDGFPTYHFANVVDDHLMKISHVLRGVEWQISTPKHLMLYKAFGWDPPIYAHLPLLMNTDGTKLSKRQGDIKISHYRENYIFPLALLNYIISSGGGFEKDQERYLKPKCYTKEELIHQFDISKLNSHSGKLLPEKLFEYNNLDLKRLLENDKTRKEVVEITKNLLKKTYPERIANGSLLLADDYITKILLWSLDRIDKLSDLISKNLEFIWTLPVSYNLEENFENVLVSIKNTINNLQDLNEEQINNSLKQLSQEKQIKYGKMMKEIRLILSGLNEGPGVAQMIVILGKENTLERINLCLNKIHIKR